MNTQSSILIFDNQFKWKYVGRCALLLLAEAIFGFLVVVLCSYVLPALENKVAEEIIIEPVLIDPTLGVYALIYVGLCTLFYVFIALPRMCTGIYRINGDYLQVKEKLLSFSLVEMYIPLSALTAVHLKKNRRWRKRFYPYKILEIEASGTTYDLRCLTHQEELYQYLCKVIESSKTNY